MQNKIIYTLFIMLVISFLCSCGGVDSNEEDSNYPCIKKRKLAVMLVTFPDIPERISEQFPTVEQAQEYFFNPSIKEYFNTMSWGQFKFEGDVCGYFEMPDSLIEERRNNEYIIKTTESYDLQIPNFDEKEYDAVAFIIFHDKYEQGGLSASNFANFTVNGKWYEKQDVMYIGAWINDTTNTYTRPITCKTKYGNSIDDIWEENHPIYWKYNQAIFTHEFIHLIRGDINIPHANTCTNNGRADYEDPDTINQPKRFLNLEYGNKFDLMGGGSLALSLNGAYRKLAGWCNDNNTLSILEKSKHEVLLHPLNSTEGIRLIEIRIQDKEKHKHFPEHSGYFIELRQVDKWDACLENEMLKGNTEGVMLYKSDGFTSMLLDMSPSSNFIDIESGKHTVDYRDMVLKPGHEYENNEIKIINVRMKKDGSYVLDIELK